jgi:hypothetical protein
VETASILGRILGGLEFVEDIQGRYDEFPAYVAEKDGYRYALLGVPAPEEEIRDNPTKDFELMLLPILPLTNATKIDVSDELILKISRDGLKCWSLK